MGEESGAQDEIFNDIYRGDDPYELGLIDQPSEITPESLLNFDTETS